MVMMGLLPVILLVVMGQQSPVDPGNTVMTELQGAVAARVRVQMPTQPDEELFDALLSDASGYYWSAANARVEVSAVPALQKIAQDYLRSLVVSDLDKAMFDGLLSDLRAYKWELRPSTGAFAPVWGVL